MISQLHNHFIHSSDLSLEDKHYYGSRKVMLIMQVSYQEHTSKNTTTHRTRWMSVISHQYKNISCISILTAVQEQNLGTRELATLLVFIQSRIELLALFSMRDQGIVLQPFPSQKQMNNKEQHDVGISNSTIDSMPRTNAGHSNLQTAC